MIVRGVLYLDLYRILCVITHEKIVCNASCKISLGGTRPG
jgi:hypothetical protein